MNKIADITFSQAEIEAFRRASHDENPLHTDPEYARRGPFGKPVVYGILTVLKSLGAWKFGSAKQIKTLRAVFKKPFFQGETYTLHQEERQGQLFFALRRGPVDYMHLSVQAAPLEFEKAAPIRPFQPLHDALDQKFQAARQQSYLPETSAASQLRNLCGIGQNTLSDGQLSALLWASYQVGMETPGRQALFAELEVEFAHAQHGFGLHLDLEATDFDERFNRILLQGRGSGLERLRIVAFRRPEPVQTDWKAFSEADQGPRTLEGKRVFISGASRGFGAALACAAAALGAKVALNYRSAGKGPSDLTAHLEGQETETLALQGDMGVEAEVERMAAQVREAWGGLDLVLNNAMPQIANLQFFEQSHADFVRFLQNSLQITLLTARHILPLLSENGVWADVSTQYLDHRPKGFSHYTMVKAANADLCRNLSLEHPHWNFLVAKLPVMLTDQTNLPFHLRAPADPMQMAFKLLHTAVEPSSEHFREVDFGGE